MKLFGKIVILSWCLTLSSCVYAGIHAGDRDPEQVGSSVLAFFVLFFSGILNFIYSVVSTIPCAPNGSVKNDQETTNSSDQKV